MKKKKAKLHEDMVLRIRELRASIRVRERWLKIVFRDRHTLSTPEQRRRAVTYLREKRYELEVFEKQIKMPVRITVTRCVVIKPRRNSPTTECRCIISKEHCCPRCERELRIFDANDEWALLAGIMQPKYCPYCGQKLWWNR